MKRIISLFTILSVIFSFNINIFAKEIETDKVLLRVKPSSTSETSYSLNSEFTLNSDSSGVVMTVSDKGQGRFSIVPSSPINIEKRNLVFRYKVKYDSSESTPLTYIRVRIYGKGVSLFEGENAPSTEYAIKTSPSEGTWYEGEFTLDKTEHSDSARPYDVGDTLTSFMMDFRNNSGINYTATLEYLEIIEKAGADDSYPVYRPKNSSNLYHITAKNAEIASATPGSTIYIADGEYTNAKIIVPENVKGTADKPVIIRPQHDGKVILKGNSSITVNGQYVIIEGFYFTDGFARNVITFSSKSSNSTLRSCAIIDYNGINCNTESFEEGEKYPLINHRWVAISGNNTTVENCYFREKYGTGVMFEISLGIDGNGNEYGRNVTVRNNYFGYYRYAAVNGTETIRVGLSGVSLQDANAVITGNFFERCNGEDELISSKSSSNTYSYNTFYASKGAVTLRHGDNCTVNGNLFVGLEGTNSGTLGIRVIGKKNKIYDNYFLGLPYNSRAVAIEAGVKNAGLSEYPLLLDSYSPVEELDMHNNSFINCGISVSIGTSFNGVNGTLVRNQSPEGDVYNNLTYTTKTGKNIFDIATGASQLLKLDNNIYYGNKINSALSSETGLIKKKPLLIADENMLYSTDDSTGADLSEVNKAPKNPFEVIPSWVNGLYESGELFFSPVAHDVFNNISYEHSLTDILILGKDISYAYKNGEKILADENDKTVGIKNINGRILVPLRFVAETMGATVLWDHENKHIRVKSSVVSDKLKETVEYNAELNLNSNEIKIKSCLADGVEISDKIIKTDFTPMLINGRTYVSVRAFEELSGMKIYWDDRGIAIITPSVNLIKKASLDDAFIINSISKILMADFIIGNLSGEYLFDNKGDTDYTNDIEGIKLSWDKSDDVDKYMINVIADRESVDTVYTTNEEYTYIYNSLISPKTHNLSFEVYAVKNDNLSIPSTLTFNFEFGGGMGTEALPYRIYNLRHFNNMRKYTYASYLQCADLYEPVTSVVPEFSGSYTGEGEAHRIITLDITDNESAGVGLFGELNGKVSNILTKGTVTTSTASYKEFYNGISTDTIGGVGAIAGFNKYQTAYIENCVNEATVIRTNDYSVANDYGTGGIIGCIFNEYSVIENCENKGNVISYANYTGGICGRNNTDIRNSENSAEVTGKGITGGISGASQSSVTDCSNSGKITSNGNYLGGIIGRLVSGNTEISGCFNTGEISGVKQLGGIVGDIYIPNSESAVISNCYNKGTIITSETDGSAGGIAGQGRKRNHLIIKNCFTVEASGYDVVGNKYISGVRNTLEVLNCYYLKGKVIVSKPVATGSDSEETLITLINSDLTFDKSVWQITVGKYPELL